MDILLKINLIFYVKKLYTQSLSRLIGLKNTNNMERIAKEISKHQKERSSMKLMMQDQRFINKLSRDYGLESFEQNYKAYEEKEIEKYKNAISAGFKKVMEEQKITEYYAIIKIADKEDLHIRTTSALQKTNQQFYDQLTFVWMVALEVVEEANATENEQVLEEAYQCLSKL